MEKRTLLMAMALLLAFAAGRYLLPDPTSGLTGLPREVVDAVQAWKGAGVADADLSPQAPLRRRIDRMQTKGNRVPAAVAQALTVGDPVEQYQRIADHLAKIDASNWKDVVDQFQFVSHQTGRTHNELWDLMMVRLGQVAGAGAIDELKSRGFEQDKILYGWAMADPGAAQAWLETTGMADSAHAGKFQQQLVNGLAVADPATAMQYMSTLPEDVQRSCTGDLIRTLVQADGIGTASKWLDRVLASASPELARQTFNEVAGCVARTSTPDASGPGFAQDWFLRYGNSEYITSDELGTAAQRYRGPYAVQGLDFLLAVNALPAAQSESGAAPGLDAVIQNAYQTDPEGLEKWLQSHPSAPFRDRAVQMYDALRSGEP